MAKRKRSYRSVVRAVYETPWVIREEKLQAIREFLARRTAGDVLTREEIKAAMSGRPRPAVVSEGAKVALINVIGTLCPRLSLMEDISGGVSCEALGRAIDAAAADDGVTAIVLNIDSPGGSIFGIEELADKIFAARGKKKIYGVANHEAASAGYWLLTACSEVVIAPNGLVGSIGAMMIHTSSAGWEEKQGYETTITRVPATKAEGAAGEALSAEAKADRERIVAQVYEKFVAAVARNRGVSPADVKAGYGQGRMLLAEDALAARMVDRIATLEQLLSELGVSAKAQSAINATSEPAFSFEGNDMNKKIFGALVRIGMCQITASTEEATTALDRFFAAQGVDTPAAEDDQLKALEAYIAKPPAAPTRAAAAAAAGSSVAGFAGDRAAEITAAVRLSTLSAARQMELVAELLAATDAEGQPITVGAAVRRIQKEQAEAAPKAGATSISTGAAERDKFEAAARDALLVRTFGPMGLPKQIYDRRTGAYVEWKPNRRHSSLATLLGLAEQVCVQAGYDAQAIRDLPKGNLARLIMGGNPRDLGIVASSDGPPYNVTGMFANVLLDAAHVTLRRSYDDSRTTYQAWMKQKPSLEDFKINHSAVSGELGDPKAVPEAAEFEETTFSDAKERYQLTVWGSIFSLSWQSVVNDALGAFVEVPTKLGSSMRRRENKLAYSVLKDNAAMADTGLLFNTTAQTTAGGHNNLTTGAGPPSVATLNTLTKKMTELRGLNTTDGSALNLMPHWIIGPPALRGTILELLGSFANPAVGGSAAGNSGVKNIWENALEPVIEGELGAAASGGSDVAWYLATHSNDCDHISYARLQGLETPAIETEQSFNQLALRWRIYTAFVAFAEDYHGVQKHAGA